MSIFAKTNDMKRFTICIVPLLLMICRAAGQNFDIRVVDRMQRPVAYAFITVNGVPTAVTDTEGNVGIRFSRLRSGHEIAASAIGLQTGTAKLDAKMMESGRCELRLDSQGGTIPDDRPEITSEQARAEFEAASGAVTAMDFNCTLAGRFDFDYCGDTANGEFSVENEVDSKALNFFREKGWCHHDIAFRCECDTATVSFHKLDEAIHYALSELNFAVAATGHNRHFYKYRPVYEVIGTDSLSGGRLFRISFPMLSSKAVQMIVETDAEKHIATKLRISIYDRNTTIIKHIDAEMRELYPTRKSKTPALCPVNIDYRYHTRYADLRLKLSALEITRSNSK